jgi:hypothetical protein
MNFTKCKGCKKEVAWIRNTEGKNILVDAEPENRYVMTLNGEWKMVQCFRVHWDTCPSEALFREKPGG